ncbi:hypothetical protein MXB_927 [Myxobolus squamalis]|nr:hypothetical protein MXB_927 [Myxobolus squamalis]
MKKRFQYQYGTGIHILITTLLSCLE